jgi:hypothetical protein
VEVLMRVYARCVSGLEDVWTARMEASLRPPGEPPARHDKDQNEKEEGQLSGMEQSVPRVPSKAVVLAAPTN